MRSFHISITVFALIAFASIAVFGFVTQHHGGEIGWCVAESAQGAMCLTTDAFGVTGFHLNAFRQFVQAVVPTLAVLLMALAAVFVAATRSVAAVNSRSSFLYVGGENNRTVPARLRFMRWFAHTEKRDPSDW